MTGNQDIAMWEKRAFDVGEIVPGPGKEGLRFLRLLAEGGFSEVHEGVCEPSGVHYAVKALRMMHTSNPKTIQRMLRESTTLFKLRHPNVVPVYFVGMRRADQLIYMVMELLQGRNLREFQFDLTMARQSGDTRPSSFAKLPVAWVLEIMRKVCDGLQAVHAVAIHRDLKPENIFLGDDGKVTLIDIGSAKFPKETRLTTRDMTIGTATYMSPEQIYTPEKMDTRSDLFAIGVMLYELLSGVLPFRLGEDEEDNTRTLGIRIVWHAHPPLKTVAPHLPDYIVYIVERLLRKDPRERYATAREVHDALALAHAQFVRALGDLAPRPLAEVIATLPRAQADARPPAVPSLATSTNPYVTVSMPPDVPRQSGLPAEGQPTAMTDSASPSGAMVTGEDGMAFVATEEVPTHSLTLLPEDVDQGEARAESDAAACVPEPPPLQRAPVPEAVERETDDAVPAAKALDPATRRQAEALREMIAELPDELRLAFTLNQLEERSLGEVAEITGASEGLVQQRVVEARERLGARLAAYDSAHATPSPGTAPGLPVRPTAGGVGTTPIPRPATPLGRGAGSLATHTRDVPPPAPPLSPTRNNVPKRIAAFLGAAAAIALVSYGAHRFSGHRDLAADPPASTVPIAPSSPTSAVAEPPASAGTPPPASAAPETPAPVPLPPTVTLTPEAPSSATASSATAPTARPASTATRRAAGAGVRPGGAAPKPSTSPPATAAPRAPHRQFGSDD